MVLVQGGVGGGHAPQLVALDQMDIGVQVREDVFAAGGMEDVEVETDADMSRFSGISGHGDEVTAE